MTEAYIVDAVRTPRGIGKPGKGALSHLHPQHLAAAVLKAIATRNDLDTATIDDIIWSTSTQEGMQGGDLGRMAALAAGFDIRASGTTLDRFCGGGITAISLAAASVMSGMEACVIAGGSEMMSYHQKLAAHRAESGMPARVMGAGNEELDALHPQSSQGVCADAIAAIERIDRETLDALALESQRRANVAITEGRFKSSIIPVHNPGGTLALDREEFPRPRTSAQDLAALRPSFDTLADFDLGGGRTWRRQIQRVYPGLGWHGVHHAGNSSGVVDGAAAVLIASPAYVASHGLKPRARIVAYANCGDCPTLMLNAPGPAARKVLAKAGLSAGDIDLWEVNEAFAVVVEKFIRDLSLDRTRVNVNGGAIALGHPIGATGSMLVGTILDELERTAGRYGLVTMCAGGGMAPALVIESIEQGDIR